MSDGTKHPHGNPVPPAAIAREVAENILRRHGLDAAGLESSELKRRWQSLGARRQPDRGDDARAVLKRCAIEGGAARGTSSPRVGGVPVWAWAGHRAGSAAPDAAILREDYRDRNFLKKRLWELSGRSNEEWTLWAFDGRDMLPPVVAYGSDAIFPAMAEAMLRLASRGFRRARAVLAQAPAARHEVLLLHADGRAFQPPMAIALPCAGGPACDPAFLLDLSRRLDGLAGRGRS